MRSPSLEPDQIYEPQNTDFSRVRQQLWEYNEKGIQLVFYDQAGTGRWHGRVSNHL